MGTSFKDIFDSFTTALQRATTWSEARINAFFQTVSTDVAYVTQFFVHQGPVLITDAETVLADIQAVASEIPSVAALGQAATILSEAISVFKNIVTGITQAGQQPSAAQSLVSAPDPRTVLKQARMAQADVDIAKATAAKLIAQHSK